MCSYCHDLFLFYGQQTPWISIWNSCLLKALICRIILEGREL